MRALITICTTVMALVLAACATRPTVSETPAFLPPVNLGWTWHAPRATLGAALFAEARWTKAALTAALGPASKKPHLWLWLDIEPPPSEGAPSTANHLTLDMTWEQDGRPRSASLETLSLPLERAPTEEEIAKVMRENGVGARPRTLFFDALLPGAPLAVTLSALGPPSEVDSDVYRWHVLGPEQTLQVRVSVDPDEQRVTSASWRWTDPTSADPMPTSDAVPREGLTLRAGSGAASPGGTYLVTDLWPPAVRPGESMETTRRRLGVPTDSRGAAEWFYPGCTVDFAEGRVSGLTVDSELGARVVGLPPGVLSGTQGAVARLGLPTTRSERALHWRFEGAAGVVEVELHERHKIRWTWAPTRPCDLTLPPDAGLGRGAVPAAGGDARALTLLEGLPDAQAEETWLGCLDARVGLAKAPELWAEVGWRTRGTAGPALRAQLATVPAFATLGEDRATWVERFGPPSHEVPGKLEWIFFADDGERTLELEVSAHDPFGVGRFDELEVRPYEAPLRAWVRGLSLRQLDAGTMAFGPADGLVQPEATRTWRDGAVRFEPGKNVLTVDGKSGAPVLREWLARRGVTGFAFELLGSSVFEARARLPNPVRAVWERDAVHLVAADERYSIAVALVCGGPTLRCDRVVIGPASAYPSEGP